MITTHSGRTTALLLLLVASAALANVAGYVFDLWRRVLWFDEAVHAGTSLAVVAAIGLRILPPVTKGSSRNNLSYFGLLIGLGLVIGLAWELFEWWIGIIGSHFDTIVDLAMDLVGASAAAAFTIWSRVSADKY